MHNKNLICFRFLPPGSYIDGRALGPRKLAKKMLKIMKYPRLYYDYFRWHRYYSYQSPGESAFKTELCDLCASLNERIESNTSSVFPDFAKWWNGDNSSIET